MNAANQRQLTPVLVLLAVLLGAGLLALLMGVGSSASWGAARAPAALPPAVNPDSLPQPVPLQQFALVWEKPLFSPDRKPVTRAVDGGSSMGDLELTGIILTPGLRMVLLHDRKGDRELRLREGESLPDGSVSLVQIQPRSAVFDSTSGRTELKLPAGAPIDAPRAKGGEPGEQQAGESPDAPPPPPPRPPPSPASPEPANAPVVIDPAAREAAERLRKSIQKRREARNAAANQGVR